MRVLRLERQRRPKDDEYFEEITVALGITREDHLAYLSHPSMPLDSFPSPVSDGVEFVEALLSMLPAEERMLLLQKTLAEYVTP